MGGVRAGRSQAAKVVRSHESDRRALERADVERPPPSPPPPGTERPFVRPAKRGRGSVIRSDQIPVPTRRRAASRIESRPHPVHLLHPDLTWQQRIQGSTERVRLCTPPLAPPKTDALAQGMNPGVG